MWGHFYGVKVFVLVLDVGVGIQFSRFFELGHMVVLFGVLSNIGAI